jgi:hypothetical protein
MKAFRIFATLTGLLGGLLSVSATTYYVAQNNAGSAPPYTNWSIAATNIQDAINTATNGDQILVTNGVYAAGGLAMAGTMTNRACLNKPLTVQSVNGPWVTFIQGAGPNGPTAVRCAWLTNGASLVGFTLQGGATQTSGDSTTVSGGGVWCGLSNAVVANCVIESNTASYQGAGAYQGALKNCFITGNVARNSGGGGSAYASMTSCTIVNNSGSGVYDGICTNCIIYYNTNGGDSSGLGTFNHCCTSLALGNAGNFTNAPQLFPDGVHLTTGSPCMGTGANVVTGTDIFGNSWANPPSIGCAEVSPPPLASQPQIKLTSNPVGFTLGNAAISGQPPFSYSWLQNGVALQNNGHFNGTQTTNLAATGVSFADAANYQLVVSNSFGVVTSAAAPLVIHCVAASGASPVPPYSTWATAATNIQDAITAAATNEVVLVTNGVYTHGGISMDGVIINCVSVNKAILVQSVNGPSPTIIQGAWDPTAITGPGAVRCAWLTNNAILSGFTLQGGATRSYGSPLSKSMEGGGVWGWSTNAQVCNCVIVTNCTSYLGGGAYMMTLNQCTLIGNRAIELMTYYGASGGGAANCNLRNCCVIANSSQSGNGGGTQNCLATNCVFLRNSAPINGSAINGGSCVNCTVTGNFYYGGNSGAAVCGATLMNCIVSGNFSGSWWPGVNYSSSTLTYCDADPLASGVGNIDVNPQLLADGVHLAPTSPCIGAGTYAVTSGTDIDGQPWNDPPSIGCDEWAPAPLIGSQPTVQVNSPAHGLTVSVVAAGQSPIHYFWSFNGTPLQDDGHHGDSSSANLVVNNFGAADAGLYQVVVSNAFGMATSQVAQVVIHVVNAAGANPVAPYSTWTTAATNIQDAINAAAAGDIVLVTNGVYEYGGIAVTGTQTNRVALTAPMTVISVNGCASTVIQGAWDPVSTNGPGAVRCAYLVDGAQLIGFTLQNGATQAAGDTDGGGVWCNSGYGIVSNCILSNNCAMYGGGIAYGTLNNSLVIFNQAFADGGGAYDTREINCTVVYNVANTPYAAQEFGAGAYGGQSYNSIILNNYDNVPIGAGTMQVSDNYAELDLIAYNTCTSPLLYPASNENTNAPPQFLDSYHLATTSPCRGAGSATYASGTDLDGQPWANPPSMGCSEVVVSNLSGPLAVSVICYQTNVVVNQGRSFAGFYTGRASSSLWSFGDGHTATNLNFLFYTYTNVGTYTVTYTVFNNDNPAGVSASTVVDAVPLNPVPMQAPLLLTNGFQFQFFGQNAGSYTAQYTTNLVPPVTWTTFWGIVGTNAWYQITDTNAPTGTRFYRVLAQ